MTLTLDQTNIQAKKASTPMFWRDSRMPHVELRRVEDGRKLHYAPHSHMQWSLGAITKGQSTFIYRDDQYQVSEGTLVIMNPSWVHACNPIDNQHWSYLMLYVDTDWLTNLRYELGLLKTDRWEDIPVATLSTPKWYLGYCEMVECLLDTDGALEDKQAAVVEYLSGLMVELSGQVSPLTNTPTAMLVLADYLEENASEEVSLETMCELSGYSSGHLIRSFKQYFGLTPHAYLVNHRIQCGQQDLKNGNPIADAAVDNGFADQPHFQRTFKKLLAVTPKQYRQSLLNNQKDTAGQQ
jgi:AraC-like DNA-binding protein